jgi:hypothetical protein
LAVVAACAAVAWLPATRAQDVDPSLKPYQKASGEVAGSLKCVGSDTMNNLVALWAEGFKKVYPSVREGIEGKGSASAPPALVLAGGALIVAQNNASAATLRSVAVANGATTTLQLGAFAAAGAALAGGRVARRFFAGNLDAKRERGPFRSLFFVPLVDEAVHDAAQFVELFLVMDHFGAGQAGD